MLTSTNWKAFSFLVMLSITTYAYGQETNKSVKSGEFGLEFSYGYTDLYRLDENRFKPIGPNRKKTWLAGFELRNNWKFYEIRVGAHYVEKGGIELFDTFTDGQIESDLSLSYVGLKILPVNLKFSHKSKLFAHIGAGGYGAYLVKYSLLLNSEEIQQGSLGYELDPVDYGIVIEGGLGWGPINIIGTLQTGLFNIDQQTDDVKNQLLTIGLVLWM